MDPLTVLRNFVMGKRIGELALDAAECRFGTEYRFPRTMETGYRKRDGGRYTVEALVVLAQHLDVKHSEYIKLARAENVAIVTFTDRKTIQDYLEGRIKGADAIELIAPIAAVGPDASALGSSAAAAYSIDGASGAGRAAKRARADGSMELGEAQGGELGLAGAGGADGPLVDAELRGILKKERPLRSLEGMMLCRKNPTAFANVLSLIDAWEKEKRQEEKAKRRTELASASKVQQKPKAPPGTRALPSTEPKAPRPSSGAHPAQPRGSANGGMGNPEERRYWKEYMGTDAAEALGIDPATQSFTQGAGGPTGSSAPSGQALALPAPPSHKAAPHERSKPHQRGGPQGSGSHRHAAQAGAPPRSGVPVWGAWGDAGGDPNVPIILVPAAAQTLINIYNVKEFLQDGKFVLAAERQKNFLLKPEVVLFERRFGRDKPALYQARENASKLSKRDWERVVAVFVLGKEWQFKGWPFQDHVEVLANMMGVFVRYEDDSVESAATVRNWNCNIISISRNKRHQDKTAVLGFWAKLDTFLKAQKSTLSF